MALQDVFLAIRRLIQSPGTTIVVVVTIALGIGANAAIYSLLRSVLLKPLPYQDPNRLVLFWETFPEVTGNFVPITAGNFHDWKKRSPVFEDMAGFRIRSHSNRRPMNLSGSGSPLRVNAINTSANLFRVLGVDFSIGRDFTVDEDRPGSAPVAILSQGLWQSHFGSEGQGIGSKVVLDGVPHEVIGVLPAGVFFPPPIQMMGSVQESAGDVFVPYWLEPDDRQQRRIRAVARLREGLSPSEATSLLKPIGLQMLADGLFPGLQSAELSPVLMPIHDQAVEMSRRELWLLQLAAALILAIACVNVANLLMVKMWGRDREIALRLAMGAPRSSIVSQLLLESVILSLAGGTLGVLAATSARGLLLSLNTNQIPLVNPVVIDGNVWLMAFAVSFATGLLFGLLPAVQSSKQELVETLKEGGRGPATLRSGRFFRKAVVAAEVAFSVLLLIAAALLLRSFLLVQDVELGFQPNGVLTVQAMPPQGKYETPEAVNAFVDRVIDLVKSRPQVIAAGAVSHLPLGGGLFGGSFGIVGRPDAQEVPADYRLVRSQYFQTMEIDLLKGRYLDDRDRSDAMPVAVIDETLAERAWQEGNALGSRLKIATGAELEVVGIVESIKGTSLTEQLLGIVYIPQDQFPNPSMTIVARTSGPPEVLIPELRRALEESEPDVPSEFETMVSLVRQAQAPFRTPAILLAAFAGLAVLLAVIGVYGVISFLVERRTHEIGVRLAIGAKGDDILRMVVIQTMIPVAIGTVLGIAASLAAGRLLSGMLYQVSPTDPTTYLVIPGALLAVALITSLIPAMRASSLDPARVLRIE